MITYVNSSNAARYNALFAEATKFLKDAGKITNPDQHITTLEEYFHFMGELPHLEGGKKYTILPLDEEVFEINANTRAINIPTSFKNNGISVQGDQISEIIYFKIDRFFDATDLNTMDIYIQWEAANGDTGASVEWVRDIESEPGKIIFGWPLSSQITETAGPVKFAVRFYKIDKDKVTGEDFISYSFSTLTATATIKPALDFSLLGDLNIIDDSKIISGRFVGSKVVGGEQPTAPKYFTNLGEEYDLSADDTIELLVHAYSTDAGTISYAWKKVGEEGFINTNSLVFIKTEDESPVAGKVYFEKESEGVYVPYSGVMNQEIFDSKDFYEQYSKCVITYEGSPIVGEYYAIATNRLGFATAETKSNFAKVPAPIIPTVSEILDKDGNKMTNHIVAEDAEFKVLMKINASTEDNGKLSYQWSKDQVEIPGATESSYEATGEGRYSIVVTNTRNKEIKTTTTKDFCRVTYPATAPIISGIVGLPDFGVGDEIDASNYIKADRADSFEYQWYMATAALEDDEAIAGADKAIYAPTEAGSYYVKVRSVYNKNTSAWVQSDLFRVIK